MLSLETSVTLVGHCVWLVGTSAALLILSSWHDLLCCKRPLFSNTYLRLSSTANDANTDGNQSAKWRILTPAFGIYLLVHACASVLNILSVAWQSSAHNTNFTQPRSEDSPAQDPFAFMSVFVTAIAIPVYLVLATRLLTPASVTSEELQPFRMSILGGIVVYVVFILLVTLSSAPPVVLLFSFYLFAAAYGAYALIKYESCNTASAMYHGNENPVCSNQCHRPLMLATFVGVVDFLLPAFGFLAGDDTAVAWLSLAGRVGDVVGYLPIAVQAFTYIESGSGCALLPKVNPWLFWKISNGKGRKQEEMCQQRKSEGYSDISHVH